MLSPNNVCTAIVTLSEDDQGLASGQYTAFYQKEVCLGSAVITEALGGSDHASVSEQALQVSQQPFDIEVYKSSKPKLSSSLRGNESNNRVKQSCASSWASECGANTSSGKWNQTSFLEEQVKYRFKMDLIRTGIIRPSPALVKVNPLKNLNNFRLKRLWPMNHKVLRSFAHNICLVWMQKCCLVLVLEWKVAIQWCGCWWGWIKLKTESDSLHHSGLTFFLLYTVEF